MKIEPETLETMWLIMWWFICLWGFRFLFVMAIAKGIGGAISGKVAALGGKRTQEQPEGVGRKSGSASKANAVSADESVQNHC